MKDFQYWLMKAQSKFVRNKKEFIADYFRKKGMKIGEGCNICSNVATSESYLISLGKNVTLAGGVVFVTHDNSVSKMIPNSTDLFGRITIGDNCFIGNLSIIMYGVSLANGIIVAAGSVVTKSFDKPNVILGGNPARIIGSCDDFILKHKEHTFNLDEIPVNQRREEIENSSKLVSRPSSNR